MEVLNIYKRNTQINYRNKDQVKEKEKEVRQNKDYKE